MPTARHESDAACQAMGNVLVLVRHGESEWNKLNLFTGWKDPDLTDKGIAEAKRAGQLLKDEGNEYRQCDLIRDLAATRSAHVLQPLIEIAKTSAHSTVRACAMTGLGTIGSGESLRALIELSREEFSKGPVFKGSTFQIVIADALEKATKQKLYLDFAAWEKWLREHPGFPAMTK